MEGRAANANTKSKLSGLRGQVMIIMFDCEILSNQAVAIAGRIYAIGGMSGGLQKADVESFDPTTVS